MMCCKSFYKIIVFLLAFSFGCLVFVTYHTTVNFDENHNKLSIEESTTLIRKVSKERAKIEDVDMPQGTGCGECNIGQLRNDKFFIFRKSSTIDFTSEKSSTPNIKKFKIISKPRAIYTDEARANYIQGDVSLRLKLLSNGKVGDIYPVKELPDGLTEKAIEAARKIKFEPQMRNGKPISVTVLVQYNFTIY